MSNTQEKVDLQHFTDYVSYDEGRVMAREYIKSAPCRAKLDRCVTVWLHIMVEDHQVNLE